MKEYYVYILANHRNGALYIGVTNNLIRRVFEHKEAAVDSYTKELDIQRLVYYEKTEDIRAAITREKQLKNWKREWKIHLIESMNPTWADLFSKLM